MRAPEHRRLDVYLGAELAGKLERRGPTRLRFTYSARVLERLAPGSLLLSASLPIRELPFGSSDTTPFFEGLLPEGAARTAVARTLGLSEGDTFGLLESLGVECAGAVVLLPEGSERPTGGTGLVRPLSAEEVERLLVELPRAPLGIAPDEGVRLSLAGLQRKLVLVRDARGAWGRPIGGEPSTHILKPAPEAYPVLVANELFCLRVARHAGIPAAHAWRERFVEIECLVVERFDRERREDGTLARIHQEDLCQALGVPPQAKYESDGGPSVRDVVQLLRELGGPGLAREILTFLDQVLLSFMLGNSDHHGKNVALLHTAPDSVRLAPIYDVVSTAVHPELTQRLAMTIGGEAEPARVDAAAWQRLAAECGLGGGLPARVRERAGSIVEAARAVREQAREHGWHDAVLDRIVAIAEARAAQIF